MILRPYQQEAVDAVYHHLRERDDNPCVVLPTASGKSIVLAQIVKDAVALWGGRVLCLVHVRELIEQNVDKIQRLCPDLDVGIHSAGLKRRDTEHSVIVAGIQSVYKRACDLGPFDLAIVDEAHLLPPDGDGTYRSFFADAKTVNPALRVIGLTATPFRMKTGHVCAPENVLNHVCYEASVRELIVQGYLCPLVTKSGRITADTSDLHIRGGEFIASEAEALMDRNDLVSSACNEIVEATRDRKACLIFASGIRHAQHVAAVLREQHGVGVETVLGDTLPGIRDKALTDFREGQLKYLVNCQVLTTGFDAPNIDCIAMLRPTMSPGLWAQAVGRGFRLHPDKQDCLILDFGGNALRHGPVDMLKIDRKPGDESGEAPAKECPSCRSVIAAGYATCPSCGYAFPPASRGNHAASADDAPVISGQVTLTEHPVEDVAYSVHRKRGARPGHPRTMRVDYQIDFLTTYSEWVCVEHDGWAREKAAQWWRERSHAFMPANAELAVLVAREGALAKPTFITVRRVSGEKYPSIAGCKLGPKPPWREPGEDDSEPASVGAWKDIDDDSIPF